MKRALLLLIFILLAVISSALTRLNLETVSFNYYLGNFESPLAVLVILAFVVGALMGLMLTLGLNLSSRKEKRRLRRTLQLREQEIRNLRDIPIKGKH